MQWLSMADSQSADTGSNPVRATILEGSCDGEPKDKSL